MNPVLMPQIAALLAKRDFGTQKYEPGTGGPMPTQDAKKLAYYGSIPEIAKARAADPKQLLANTALSNGSSTAPVAQNGWAWADGIARALSGAAGGYINRENDKKYAQREQDYTASLAQTAKLASTAQPQPQPQVAPQPPAPLVQAAQALGGGGASPTQPGQSFEQAFAPLSDGPPAPQNPPSGALPAPPVRQPAPSYGSTAARPLSASPTSSPVRPNRGSSGSGAVDARTLYFTGIVPIEGGTDPKTGRFRTSPKGAIGPGQVMPGTAPIAAKLAGVPFDDKKYRTDPEYNNLLGQAYFAEQLRVFGDPVKAAAAYNAGPGRVSRALRQSERKGGDWTQYLPAETRKYVVNFAAKVGDGANATSDSVTNGGIVNENVAAVGPVAVNAPEYEAVPELAQANFVPPEVQSNRIAMAQQLLQSGNPDLVAMAQTYLDKGLDEQNAARTSRNAQEFTQGRDERGYEVDRRTRTEDRNFGRERTFVDQDFTSRENAAGREQQAGLANADRSFTSRENQITRDFEADQARIEREARAAEIKMEYERKATGSGWLSKDPLWTTATGQKEVEKRTSNINSATDNIDKIDQFLALNENMPTGGARSIGIIAGAEAALGNDALSQMMKLQKQITIGTLGGLGVAISDGDRQYVDSAFLSVGSSYESNKSTGAIMKGIAERAADYENAYLNWRADNGPRSIGQFTQLWNQYKSAQPIVMRDGKTARLNDKRISFDQWIASIPFEDGN